MKWCIGKPMKRSCRTKHTSVICWLWFESWYVKWGLWRLKLLSSLLIKELSERLSRLPCTWNVITRRDIGGLVLRLWIIVVFYDKVHFSLFKFLLFQKIFTEPLTRVIRLLIEIRCRHLWDPWCSCQNDSACTGRINWSWSRYLWDWWHNESCRTFVLKQLSLDLFWLIRRCGSWRKCLSSHNF